MAHGHWLASGRPLALMVHVNVGLANTLMGVINAARDNVPLLLLSGRTPIGEGRDRLGARDLPIHWGQEIRDQGGMLRELVKWDYELRSRSRCRIVDRRSRSRPAAEARSTWRCRARSWRSAGRPGARKLCSSGRRHRCPLARVAGRGGTGDRGGRAAAVITSRAGAFADGSRAHRARRALRPAGGAVLAVAHLAARLASDALRLDPGPALAEADLVLVVDALVPWVPRRHELARGCRVVQLGPDPLFAATPVRGFPCDLALAGEVATSLRLLAEALEDRLPARVAAERRERLAARHAKARAERLAAAEAGGGPPMTPAFVSRTLARALPEDAILVSELGCDPSVMGFAAPGSYFGHPSSGGLGWGVPAALGIKLARPDRTVVATVGDGSYLFANPPACHQAAEALDLPILTVVMNNGVWNAVDKTTRLVYPDGSAARANAMPLTSLRPAPDTPCARAIRATASVSSARRTCRTLSRARSRWCGRNRAGAARRAGGCRYAFRMIRPS